MYQEAPQNCPVCQNNKSNKFRFIQDFKSDDGCFSLFQCLICQVQFWLPFKNPGADWYGKRYSFDSDNYYPVRRDSFILFTRKNKIITGKKIFDIGCGGGDFLSIVKKLGADVYGADFNEKVINFARQTKNLDNLTAISSFDELKKYEPQKFNFVTAFEIIEHLDSPLVFLLQVKELLEIGGVLVLSTPNRKRCFVNKDSFDYPPNHLIRFSKESITYLLEMVGFKIIRLKKVNDYDLFFSTLYNLLKINQKNISPALKIDNKKIELKSIKIILKKFLYLFSRFNSIIGVGNSFYIEVVKK